MIEVRQGLCGKSQPGGHGVHHVEPLDVEHLVHQGVHVEAAQGPGHESGQLHLGGKMLVQLPLPLRHRHAGKDLAAGLPGEGLKIGDENGDLPRDPVAPCVGDGHGKGLIAPQLPVGLRIKAYGQGGGVAGAHHQALRSYRLSGADIGDGGAKGAHRGHRVGDGEGGLIHLPCGLHLDGVDPGQVGVYGVDIGDEPAGGGVL